MSDSKKKILVIDDNEDLLLFARTVLEEEYLVLSAVTGAGGIEIAKAVLPNLILIDLTLPDVDGIELVRRLRPIPGLTKVPILAFTARRMAQDKLKASDVGFDAFISKPVGSAKLLDIVKLHLFRHDDPTAKPQILLVIDPANHDLNIEMLIGELSFKAIKVSSSSEALNMIKATRIDLVIADLDIKEHNGLELCRILKSTATDDFIPIVIFSRNPSKNFIRETFEAGADDHLLAPLSRDLLFSRLNSLLRQRELTTSLKQLNQEIRSKTEELKAVNKKLQLKTERLEIALESERNTLKIINNDADKLKELSISDDLTGLYNVRHFGEFLDREFKRSHRYGIKLSMMMIDVNSFKSINDIYGHKAGDYCLKNVASVILRSIRTIDFAARYGGDEFVIILPETATAGAKNVAGRIIAEITKECFVYKNVEFQVSLSIGISMLNETIKTTNDLIEKADFNMYQAKKSGKNIIYFAD